MVLLNWFIYVFQVDVFERLGIQSNMHVPKLKNVKQHQSTSKTPESNSMYVAAMSDINSTIAWMAAYPFYGGKW